MRSSDLVGSGDPLFVFIDESGNFDFSEKGTRHFVLSAHITQTPLECGAGLSALTYEFLSRGLIAEVPFHATSNTVGTRNRFIGELCATAHSCRVISMVVDKWRITEELRAPPALLAYLGARLVEELEKTFRIRDEIVVLLFDTALTATRRAAVLRQLKGKLKSSARTFRVLFRPVKHDVNGQIADHYAWATFRASETKDDSWVRRLPGPHQIHLLK
ncbi:unannotated protein [freshwater metagenome]|uniref:Unannotated protein n=1 Tax=freshwater metagenome TaxID=449393 RepID=A0A6J6JBV2_9ZZZZ|nr:hypothetical protein [Actinomycetota bacterium]MUH53903.1 hypothetical protein [Actinomycetota bacterium]